MFRTEMQLYLLPLLFDHIVWQAAWYLNYCVTSSTVSYLLCDKQHGILLIVWQAARYLTYCVTSSTVSYSLCDKQHGILLIVW